MHIRPLAGITALVIALGALALPSAEPALAGSTCTGWKSFLRPPASIRVYRTATKRTETVPFRTYVEKVMASEWGATSPDAALRAGAVAVKQFGWYYTIRWRGGRDAAGRCYDVRDSSVDQVYDPRRSTVAAHRRAVAATWWISLRKNDRFFLTGYRAGTGSCKANIDGWRLYQRDAVDCVRRYDDTTEKLGRRFYSSVSWITRGTGDWTGDGKGDMTTLTVDPDTGATTARVYTSDTKYRTAVGAGPLDGITLSNVAEGELLGRAAGDVDADGRADLVQLVDTEAGIAVEVIQGTAAGFEPARTWWTDDLDPAALERGSHRLVVSDFTGDGRADAGIVRIIGGDTPVSSLFVARSTGSEFLDVTRTWTAATDLSTSEVLTGDVSGDGLGDLVVVSPDETGGSELRVARSTRFRTLGNLNLWGTEALPLEDIKPLIGDANRDGRDDLLIVRRSGADGMRLVAYRSPTSGSTFMPATLTTSLPLSFSESRLSVADASGDGRADVYVLVDRGTDGDGNSLGTSGWRLMSSATSWTAKPWFSRTSVPWAATFPY
jgi:hypothetical protein